MSERRRVPVSQEKRRARQTPPPPADEPAEAGCSCPRLERDEWHEVESDWSDIAFLKTTVKAFGGLPVGYAASRAGLLARAEGLGCDVPEDAMLLFGEGRFARPLLLEVEDAPEGNRDIVRPGGIAYTRVVAAPWGELKRAVRETRDEAAKRYRELVPEGNFLCIHEDLS